MSVESDALIAQGDKWLEAALPGADDPIADPPDTGAGIIACGYYLRALLSRPDSGANVVEALRSLTALAAVAKQQKEAPDDAPGHSDG